MSYNKLGFTSGQTLKADHLNHMEEGIANAGGNIVVVEVSMETMMLSYTPAEIAAMQLDGKMVLFNMTGTVFQCETHSGKVKATSSVVRFTTRGAELDVYEFNSNGEFVSGKNYLLTATEQ